MPKKRDQAKIDEQLQDLRGLINELRNESDRAAVIVGAAFLDEQLRTYIASFLVENKQEVDGLFGPDRPLGSFGARIRIAYCLGLLSDDEYHDLKIIQDIRNTFAHQLHGLTFADEWVASRCHDLTLPQKTLPPDTYANHTPRMLFMLIVSDLTAAIVSERFFLLVQNGRRVVPDPRSWRFAFTRPS